MEIEAQPPTGGRTFQLRVTGRGKPGPGVVALLVISLVVLVFLVVWGQPSFQSGTVTEPTKGKVLQVVAALQWILVAAVVGLVAAAFAQAQEYGLMVHGEADGALHCEGTSVPGGRQVFSGAQGPFCLAVIRRLRSDLAIDSVAVGQQQLLASSLEDESADDVLAGLLRTEFAVVDGSANEHLLLSVPGPLPKGTADVMERLRTGSKGTLERLRGGGWVLRLPRRPGS